MLLVDNVGPAAGTVTEPGPSRSAGPVGVTVESRPITVNSGATADR